MAKECAISCFLSSRTSRGFWFSYGELARMGVGDRVGVGHLKKVRVTEDSRTEILVGYCQSVVVRRGCSS